jgi:hypothetical protein
MLSPGGARGVEKAELDGNVDSDNNHWAPQGHMYYICITSAMRLFSSIERQGYWSFHFPELHKENGPRPQRKKKQAL